MSSLILKISLVTVLLNVGIFAETIYTWADVECIPSERHCTVKPGRPLTGILKWTRKDGHPSIYSFKNGKEIEYKEFFPDGKIRYITPFDGIGKEYSYLENYIFTTESNYENGMKEGLERKFMKNILTGEIVLTEEYSYRNDKEDGLHIGYSLKNGGVETVCTYKNGKMKSSKTFTSEGLYNLHEYDAGKIISSHRYKNGKKIKLSD
ncbi:MAG: hypothetical protein Q8N01_01720 [Sulfuricurvum sp.]|nr:hypothetical protein [Sulfuricurvum sp.]